MRPEEALDQARVVLNDPGPSPRYTNAVLLPYFNDFQKAMARKRADLFHEMVDLTLVTGEFQSVSRADTNGLVDIIRNSDKAYVVKIDRRELEMQSPDWRRETNNAKPCNWCMTVPDNPFDFMVFPQAAANDTLKAVVAKIPADVLIGDIANDLPRFPSTYRAAAAAYVAGRALAVNTSSVDVDKGMTLMRAGLEAL